MKLGRCPVCHHALHLEALVQDQAGKQLLGIMAKLPVELGSSMLSYLGLFRPAKSDLNNGRALRLLEEVISLTPNQLALMQALDQTVNQISASRAQSADKKPLSNHNYLKKVLHSIPGWDVQAPITQHGLAIRGTTGDNNEVSRPTAKRPGSEVSHAILDIDNDDWARG